MEFNIAKGRTEPGDNLGGLRDADLGLKFGFSQNQPIVLSVKYHFRFTLWKNQMY
jgi:hypothetical protein